MKIVSTKPLSLTDVKDAIEEREKQGQLSYEQQQALEHAKKFASEKAKEDHALAKKLGSNEKLTQDMVTKIVDIKPKKPETLKLILAKDKIELSEEEIAEIIKKINDA